jgi:hypothetical protein
MLKIAKIDALFFWIKSIPFYQRQRWTTKGAEIVVKRFIIIIVMTFLVRECYGSPKKHENLLKFVKIHAEKCFDKVLNEELKRKLMEK